jgi:hypothetical protein
MPTAATSSFEPSLNRLDPVFSPMFAKVLNVSLNAPTSGTTVYSRGTLVAEFSNTASVGIYAGYSSTATNGLQTPKGILQYTVTIDTNGNVALAGEFGQQQRGAPMYMPGMAVWRVGDLIGLDANALTVLNGAYVEGSSTGGLVQI